MSLIFSDNFNRVDSNTVGNGWSENASAAADEQILSNALRLGTGSTNTSAGVYRSLSGSRFLSLSCNFSITSDPSSRPIYFYPYFSAGTAASFTGVGVSITRGTVNNVIIVDNSTAKVTGSYSISAATTYYLWVDIIGNGTTNVDVNVYLSTTSTKPGSATVSTTNFTPTNSSGTNMRIQVDSTNSGQWNVDDISISDYPSTLSVSDTETETDAVSLQVASVINVNDTEVESDSLRAKIGWNTSPSSTSTWTLTSK